jgi:hypothetical protein
MTDIILSRRRLPFLNQLCEDKGIIGEPIIFQTRDNKEHKMTSILGEGTNDREWAMYWILGELLSSTLAHFPIIDPTLWCRKCWLHAQRHQPRQYCSGPSRSYRAGVHVFESGCHVHPRPRHFFSVYGFGWERFQKHEIVPYDVGQTVSSLARFRHSLGSSWMNCRTSPTRLLPMPFPL